MSKEKKDTESGKNTELSKPTKIQDIISLVKAGAPIIYAHDRDIRFFISSILTKDSALGDGPLDDFDIFIFFQGFMLERVVKTDGEDSLSFKAVQVTNPLTQVKEPVEDPRTAFNYYLEKAADRITEANKSVFIYVTNPSVIDQTLTLGATLREHYTRVISVMQTPTIKRNTAASGGTKHVAEQEEYTPGTGRADKIKSIIILGTTVEPPTNIVGYCVNMGMITHKITPKKEVIPKNLLTGITISEHKTGVDLINAAKDKDAAVELFKRMRKGVFTSNTIIEEIDDINTSLDDIGGYKVLREFADQRKRLFTKIDELKRRNVFLKGVFLAGVPGSGKSTYLRALGRHWGLPSYELMLEAAFGKYVGESETRLISALDTLEKLAPCFVLMDEIDKSLAGIGENEVAGSDVPRKVFGILLKYMMRPNNIIFGVSANRVENLPEELTRKGRIDRVFFLDLPNNLSIAQIMKIHLGKRGYEISDLTKIDKPMMEKAIEAMNGFTGAEVETAVQEAVMRSIDTGTDLTPALLYDEAVKVTTIDKDKQDIVRLRKWAQTYAINAEQQIKS